MMTRNRLATFALLFASLATGCAAPRATETARAFRPAMLQAGAVPYLTLVPVIDARKYGVSTTKADNVAAINDATAAAGQLGQPASVHLPAGTLTVAPSGAGNYIIARSNVSLVSPGGTTLKVKNNAGNFKAIISQGAGAVSNFTVEGITFDLNPSGNTTGTPAVGSANTEQYAIYLPNATGTKVRNCRFDPCSGINTVVLTGDHSETTGNYVNFVPRVAPAAYDNSAFYLSGPNYVCSGNTFKTAIGSGGRGACEMHEAGGVFTGNVVDGFQTMVNGVNAFSATYASNDLVITGNTGRNLCYGVTLWSITGKPFRNIVVNNNTISLAQTQHYPYISQFSRYSHGIAAVWDSTCQGSIENWTSSGNTVTFEDEGGGTTDSPEYLSSGIRLTGQGATTNVVCNGNVILRAPGPGIRLSGTLTGASINRARVANNVIVDAGQNVGLLTGSGAYRTAFSFEGVMGDVVTESNSVYDTGRTLGLSAIGTGGTTTVTVDTAAAHGWQTGQQVTIAGCTPSGYNGTYTITRVDADTFTYTVGADPGASTVRGTAAGLKGVYEAVQYGGTYTNVLYQNNVVSTAVGSLIKSLSAAGLSTVSFVGTGTANTFTALNTFSAGANFGGPPSIVSNVRIGATYAPTGTSGSHSVIAGQMIASPTANSSGLYYATLGHAQTPSGNAFNFTGALSGLRGGFDHFGSGTVAEGYGLILFPVSSTGGGTITNGGGLSIEAQTVGGVTNAHAINQKGASDLVKFAAPVRVVTAGNGLMIKEGSNAKQGTATLAAGTATVSNTSVTASSRIVLTAQDNNTTGAVRVSGRTAGTSFTVTSSNAGDTGVVAYEIFEPAP